MSRIGQDAHSVERIGSRDAWFFLIPALIALATLSAELFSLAPPYPSDQINYLEAARAFPSAPVTEAIAHQYMRVGLVLPMAVAVKIFGYSQIAYYLVPLLAGVALALAVYALGNLLFSRVVGVAAALLSVANTATFVDLTAPLPDLLATALFCWALVLAIAIRQERPAVSGTPRRRAAALLAIGGLLGWSYLAREFIVFVWPLVPLLLWQRVGLRGLVWLALPLVVVGLGEMSLNAHLYGDPLARLHASSEHGSGPLPEELASTFQNKPRVWYLTRLSSAIGTTPEGAWLNGALLATVIGGLLRPRRLGLLLLWVALLYVPLVLLGGVLSPAAPMLRLFKVRYWFPILPAFLLGGVAVVWLLAGSLSRRVPALVRRSSLVAGALALLLAATPVVIAQSARWQDASYRVNGATQLEQFRSWLAAHGDGVTRLWTDRRSHHVVEIFTYQPLGGRVWDGEFQPLSTGARPKPQPGDHVVLYSAQSPFCGHCRAEISRVLGSPVTVPSSWKAVFRTNDGIVQVYEVR